MKRLHNKVRVLIVDGSRGMVLRNDGDALSPNLKLVKSYEQEIPRTHELGTDKPGRTNESTIRRRSSMETPDWHQMAEDRFVQMIADEMAKDLAEREYSALVVAAPPAALGEYRKAAGPEVAKVTICEIDKDLTRHPVTEIGKLVAKALEEA
jgi:protein required for attachment to host cells